MLQHENESNTIKRSEEEALTNPVSFLPLLMPSSDQTKPVLLDSLAENRFFLKEKKDHAFVVSNKFS